MRYLIFTLFAVLLILSFSFREKKSLNIVNENKVETQESITITPIEKDKIENGETTKQASEFVAYAKTLMGTPYLYGSVDPAKGLDCSGFINHVSDHFAIKVPRSSVSSQTWEQL